MKPSNPLLTQLLLKHPDASKEEYNQFLNQLIKHHFTRLLHLYDDNTIPSQETLQLSSIPAEKEILFLLGQEYPDQFLKNILYHLRRNNKVIPAAILPMLLTKFKDNDKLWNPIYHQQPELILALAGQNGDWNYMLRAFHPDITLQLGSPGFYIALRVRLHIYPLQTVIYIIQLFPDASPIQQGRLLDILNEDPSQEARQFIKDQLNSRRKPVRQAALRSILQFKQPPIYKLLLDALNNWIRTNEDIEINKLPVNWKDLSEIADEKMRENILIALTDPMDYPSLQSSEYHLRHRTTLIKAAIFHNSQRTLYNLATSSPTLFDEKIIERMDPKTATKSLQYLSKISSTSFDQNYLNLLHRIYPFMSESDTDVVWKKFVEQWLDLPDVLENKPLELLALRIHPNRIKTMWQHPLLQENTPGIRKIRETLKNRLAFLKKCYK